MNLHRMLLERAASAKPLRIGLIGAGKFGAMYLSQIPTTPGIHLLGIADLSPPRARENLARLGWKPEVTAAGSFAEARRNGNTFLTDDWKALVANPAIESTAVSNATGLTPAPDGLAFPPCSVEDLPFVMRPASEGGQLHHKGQVEVASSLEKDGRAIPYEIRKGVWVVFEASTDYQKNCFEEYMLCTDPSGRHSVMYKRWHLIG